MTGNKYQFIFITALLILAQAYNAPSQEMPPDTILSKIVSADTIASTFLSDDSLFQSIAFPDTILEEPLVLPLKKEELEHSPRKAAMYSAILPGLGQAYNKKYWKIPLVYGGFVAFGYFIGWNHENFQVSKNAYRDLTDSDNSTTSYMNLKQIIYYNLENPSDVERLKHGLLRRQDYFRRNRDLLVILTVGFYGLNIIDASVDAHFFNFDISDDLTLKWQPTIDQLHNKNIFALNCTIRF